MLEEQTKTEDEDVAGNDALARSEKPSAESTLKLSNPLCWADLYGVGREIWAGIDAQEYVDRLRNGEDDDDIAG